jgi:hypothetical protein
MLWNLNYKNIVLTFSGIIKLNNYIQEKNKSPDGRFSRYIKALIFHQDYLLDILIGQKNLKERSLLNIFGIKDKDLDLVQEEFSNIESNMGGRVEVIENVYDYLIKNIINSPFFKDDSFNENITINISIASDGVEQFEVYLGENLLYFSLAHVKVISLDNCFFHNLFNCIFSNLDNKDAALDLITKEPLVFKTFPWNGSHFSQKGHPENTQSLLLNKAERDEIYITSILKTISSEIFTDDIELDLFSFVVDFVKDIKEYLKNTIQYQYIGPLRKYPERKDFFKLIKPKLIEYNRAWDSIWNDFCIEDINEWFSSEIMGGRYKVEILEWKSNRKIDQIYELAFYDKITKTYVNSQEMGLGISQFLPIIVMSNFQFPQVKGDLKILVEQPELHLHPSLQAEIADFLIKIRWVGGCIVETHSEHILLRIMKRMRETSERNLKNEKLKITPEDVALLYIDADEERGTYITELELSQEGELLDPWPGGFFEEGFEERFF